MIDFDIESFVRKRMTKRPESLLAADFARCAHLPMGRAHPQGAVTARVVVQVAGGSGDWENEIDLETDSCPEVSCLMSLQNDKTGQTYFIIFRGSNLAGARNMIK